MWDKKKLYKINSFSDSQEDQVFGPKSGPHEMESRDFGTQWKDRPVHDSDNP